MVVIFIEGLPCAGKTELIKVLESKGNKVCHELGRRFKQHEFPGNGKTLREIENIDYWFIRKEVERYQDSRSIFFDRSYFTHLCYAYAYSRLLELPSFKYSVGRYKTQIDESALPLPKAIVYINSSSKLSIERQHRKIVSGVSAGLPPFWRDVVFLNNTLKAYRVLFACIEKIPLLTIDARLQTQQKYDHLMHWLDTIGIYPEPGSQGPDDKRKIKLADFTRLLKE